MPRLWHAKLPPGVFAERQAASHVAVGLMLVLLAMHIYWFCVFLCCRLLRDGEGGG